MAARIKHKPSLSSTCLLSSDMHPVLDRVYRNRGITSAQQLELGLQRLQNYEQLHGIKQAVALLTNAVCNQQTILIIGDFDADGATSTALALRALTKMGAQHVNYLVPNRFEYGYGLTPEIVRYAQRFKPDLIITVDNGISSLQGVEEARTAGIKVLITDHHLPAEQLPAAEAIINPNQPGDSSASKAMAGVGVIFYVMLALRSHLRAAGWFESQQLPDPNLAELLDLVALGTVADVVPFDYNNRIMVAQGLARIRAGSCCEGIKALINVAGRQRQRITAQDLGFALGPRINAAGRLDDMSLGIECLITDDETKALQLAEQLNHLNEERRAIERDMQRQALDILSTIELEQLATGICLYQPDWHQGVIGILASRIKEQYHRPVIVFADAGRDETSGQALIKGSARSVVGVHIRDTLDAIAKHNPELLSRFGGHAMAAGLTLNKKDFATFSTAFDAFVAQQLDQDDLQQVIHCDGELTSQDIDVPLAQLLENAGPWGQHFPEPVFSGRFEIVQRRIVGEKHLKLLLKLPHCSRLVDAIAFNTSDEKWEKGINWVEMAYRLVTNEFRGLVSAQLIVEYIEPLPVQELAIL